MELSRQDYSHSSWCQSLTSGAAGNRRVNAALVIQICLAEYSALWIALILSVYDGHDPMNVGIILQLLVYLPLAFAR